MKQNQTKGQKPKHMLRRFLSYYKPHGGLLAADMVASLLISVIGMAYPMITNYTLKTLFPERQYKMIAWMGLALLGLYVARFAMRYFVQYYGHMIGVRMQAQMRSDMFSHLETLPYSYYDGSETGKIMSRMTNDLMNVSELAHHGPENLLISGVMILASFTYLMTIEPLLTLIIFACVPVLTAVSMLCRKYMRDAFAERRQGVASINASLESSISGIRVTKAFTNAPLEVKKFEQSNRLFVDASRKAYRAMAIFFSSTALITDVFNVLVLIAGGVFLVFQKIDLADYSTFIVSVNLFISPVNTLIQFMEQYQDGVTGFTRFLEVMDAEPEQDAPEARDLTDVKGDICLDRVSFHYDESKEVLDQVSLHVKPGCKLALVGPSGGGKTTICHLLPRFYPLQEGSIRIDGVDIRQVSLASLRRNIGIVQQDVFLFNGSIRDNILYGRPSATEEEMITAAKRANIHEYVMSLEHGYDTEIGERGVRLSGGQKQRLSIARVFLKDPAILILDEATSALDNTTEILIQQALDELCQGRTTLVVAHRLSTVKNASEIAVISEGKIAELGSHEELIARGGIYRELYQLQFRETNP